MNILDRKLLFGIFSFSIFVDVEWFLIKFTPVYRIKGAYDVVVYKGERPVHTGKMVLSVKDLPTVDNALAYVDNYFIVEDLKETKE